MRSGTGKIMAGVMVLLLMCTLLQSFSDPIYASGDNMTVRVGFFEFPGYHEMDGNTRSGLGYDFLAMLRRYTGLNYEYVGYEKSWEEMQQMLRDGEIDMLTSARKTMDREKYFDFSEPIGTNIAQINVRADDERFIPGDHRALDGITIGELSGNTRNADVEAFAQEKGFPYRIKEYETVDELKRALQDGRVDAIATSSLRKSLGEKTIAEFAPEDFYCIVRKGDTRLLREINYGIGQMDINEGNWRDDLYFRNYTSLQPSTLVFTERERAYIEAVRSGAKVITVAAQPDAQPYSYIEDDRLVGIIPEYFAHLMEMAGLPYSVEIAADRHEFHDWIVGNRTDAVMDFRSGRMMNDMTDLGIITDPYMTLTTSRVTRKGFAGRYSTVATVDSWAGTAFDDAFDQNAEIKCYETREEALAAVRDGKADVCDVYTYTAERFINTDVDSNLQSTILHSPIYEASVYVSPYCDHELGSILNKCIKADTSGVLDEYVKKYTTVTYENMNIWNYFKLHPVLIWLGVILAVLATALLCITILREHASRIEREQHQKLEESLTFTDFFLSTYVSAYYVDLNTLSCRVYKRTDELEREFPIVHDYVSSLTEYIEKCVHPEDREELLSVSRPDNMKALLEKTNEYIHTFRDISGGKTRMYKMQVIRGTSEGKAAFGFIDFTSEYREQQRHFLGAVPLSPDILTKANIGLWAFELDEGKPPRMYVDDTMLRLIGLETQVSPEETYHAWYDHVDSGSYPLVNDAVAKMSAGDHAEVQYPWHHPDGTTMIVRCGGVRNPEYTNGIRVEGTHQNVSAVLRFDEEEQRRENESLAFKLVSSLSDSYSSLYYVNDETGDYRLITRDEEFKNKIDSRLSHGNDFFKDTQDSLEVICEEDRSKMRAFCTKEAFMAAFGEDDFFTIDYRLLIDNAPVWYRVKTVKIHNADGPVNYAIGVKSIQDQLQREEQLQKNREIIEILASEYSSVYYIDLQTDGLTPYTMNESTESAFGKIFRNGITYSDAFRMYVDERVLPADRELMMNAGSIRNIMKELAAKKTFITTYRDADGHFSEMKFVKVGDETGKPIAVALGFADKDAELRAKEEAETIRKRNTDIIEILASEYSSVYYIDLTTDELDPYTMNAETENEFGQVFRSGINYSAAFRMYVDTLVYPEDRELMLEAGSIYNIHKELADKKAFVTTYRSENNGDPHYCEMKFVKVGEGENPSAVALGFADKNDELREELKRKAIAARDAAVISGLSDDFGCVVYVDHTTGEEVHYRFDPLLSANIPEWESVSNFDERMALLRDRLIAPEDRSFFENIADVKADILDIIRKEGVFYRNFRVVIGDETRYYQLKIVRDEQSDNHVIAGLRNVDETAKKELEYQAKLEEANKSKTDFLFNMSHDIRTPMNAIIGFTQLAKKHMDDKEKIGDSLDKIELSGNHLLELINEVLDMSRVEAGKLHSDMKNVNVLQEAERLITINRENAAEHEIDLSLKAEGIIHPNVMADELHINQIIMNILGNAIKYTRPGGSVLYTVCETASNVPKYGRYVFTVEDTGIGMSPEFLKHIYDSFAREEQASTSKIQGTGLGMAIVKRLVDYLDGTIDIQSEQGRGTKVTIAFHLMIADSAESAEENAGENPVVLTGKRVLLVEDNDLNREIATDMLGDHGLIVDEAVDGFDAVEHIKEHGAGYYDFILMDIQMPRMDGYETTAQIRKLEGADKVPIIALSANAFDEDRKKSVAAGMDDHVSKPIVISKLIAVLSRFIK